MRALLFAFCIACLAYPVTARTQDAGARLRALGNEMLEREHDEMPFLEAMLQGRGPRVGRAFVDLSPGWQERSRKLYDDVLAKLARIPVSQLDAAGRIELELLRERARARRARADYPLREIGFLAPNWGLTPQLIGVAAGSQPFQTEADFEAWIARVEASAATYDQAIPALRAAQRRGWTTSRPLVEKGLRQIEAIAQVDARDGPFWGVMARYPQILSAERRASYEARYLAALEGKLLPAMRRLAAFVREEYLGKTRETAGIGALPGGDRAYRALIREYTTLDLSPDELHKMGLAEVARIRVKLMEVARSLGFKGEIRDLAAWYQANPENYPFHQREDVIAYLKRIHARVEPQLPKLFHRLPKAAFDIQLVDPAIAASASASYWRPLPDGSRPGVFRIPVVDPRRTASFSLAALLMHEGMPGHHLDIGRGMELDLAPFRKAQSITVYSEGWGLYAESLGHELGVYEEPWSLLGRYTAEIHRAARLVVDTGMHAKGWSREQAIRYLVEERGAPQTSAIVAIERYMASPGQALAYKVGEIEILKLRAEAQRELGAKFDLRDFHEVILGEGQVTLPLLGERVRAWITRQKG